MAFLLITRPVDETSELETKLDLPVLKAPLLEVEVVPHLYQEKESPYTSLIVTSSRALALFSQVQSFFKKPIWCVGEKTALKAKNLGFETIYTADNSAEDLYQLILSKTNREEEKFLHICGEYLHFDIVENLKQQGYQAEKLILYKTHPVTHFSNEILKAFTKRQIVLAPIYSRRTAKAFAHLINVHQLGAYLENITLAVCAPHIVEPLQHYKWQQIIIQPELSVSALKRLYHKIQGEEETDMSFKKLWPFGTAAILISTFLSLLSIFLIGSRLFPAQKIDTQKIQQTIETNLKKQPHIHIEEMQKQIRDVKHQIATLSAQEQASRIEVNKKIAILEKQLSGNPPASLPSDLTFQAYTLVNQLEEELNHGSSNTLLWQQIKKRLQSLSINLPESLKSFDVLPEPRQTLIQAVRNLALQQSSSPPSEGSSAPLTHRWLEKVEKYIGRIVISRETESPVLVQGTSLFDQSVQAIMVGDLKALNTLKAREDIPSPLRTILEKACQREVFLEGLKEIKGLLLPLLDQGKE